MALLSRLFRGDQKLEACLLHDVSHVTPNAVGEHVGKIQAALFIADGVDIDSKELSARRYGPEPPRLYWRISRSGRSSTTLIRRRLTMSWAR